MDNTTLSYYATAISGKELIAWLADQKNQYSVKMTPTGREHISFSVPIGPHKARWLIRADVTEKKVTMSGGVTKTFYGHNPWVFDNEYKQLVDTRQIHLASLRTVDGLLFDSDPETDVERAEITRQHLVPDDVSVDEAVGRLARMWKALVPTRFSSDGETHITPGTPRVGRTKSSRACRAYNPLFKFEKRPVHVPLEVWADLRAFMHNVLRVEMIFGRRELRTAGLHKIEAWQADATLTSLLEKVYRRFGLSMRFKSSSEGFTREKVAADHPSFVPYAQRFFREDGSGEKPPGRSGSGARFKKYMLENGFATQVPYSQHQHLAHGLGEYLQPHLAATLPERFAEDPALFDNWWK